jgi:rhodanese-related sulfurtransferase
VPEVDVVEAQGLLKEGALLVDVREDWEILEARVEQAEVIHIPLMELPQRHDEIPRDRTVLFFCRSGSRSWHAARFLLQAGHRDVLNVRGGIIAWEHAGLPVAHGYPQ